MMFDIKKEAAAIYEKARDWRRTLHMHPEIAFQEYKTAELIEKVLTEAGIEHKRVANTGVLGILKGGKPGKTIALRADIDALPLTEEVDFPYKSRIPGAMHACGHDMHTAGLLGAATILAKHKDDVPGTVKFIFQPAEERPPGGAIEMIKGGVLEGVDMIFGLHVTNVLEAGQVKVNYGYSSANSDTCNITIIGKGGHGAHPQATKDAVLIGAQVVNALHTIVSRNIAALSNAVITVGAFNSGTINNIIAERAELKLTVRSLEAEVQQVLKDRITEVTEGICKAYGAEAIINYAYGYPATFNNETASDIAKAAALELVGEENTQVGTVASMGGEDFSYYAQKVPGSFFNIGSKPTEGEVYPGHNPKFFVNEEALKTGMAMMCRVVYEANK